MNTEKLRQELIRQIEDTDDTELLLRIKNIIENSPMVSEPNVQYEVRSNEDIVAYTVDGKPLTKAEYIADIEMAAREIDEGKGIPHEQVKAEMQKWIENRLSGTL